jgi:hypothetical protein
MDLETATTLEELERRFQCVVHYGTWAMQGWSNPDHVFKTIDTKLQRGNPQAVREDYVTDLFPTFSEKVLGLGSEVVRYMLSTVAPKEYKEALEIFEALPETRRMKMSDPTFSTLAVLGINSCTSRHVDRTDVKFGLAGLVALSEHTTVGYTGHLRKADGSTC